MSTLSTYNLKHPDAADNQITFTSGGNTGIGTASPAARLHVADGAGILVQDTGGTERTTQLLQSGNSFFIDVRDDANDGQLVIRGKGGGSASEYARFDGSGRLLVGTSSAAGDHLLQIVGIAGGTNNYAGLSLRREYTPLSNLGYTSPVGMINFEYTGGGVGARIAAYCDVNSGVATDDYPTRLVFSTSADGASSPTERLHITNGGFIKGSSAKGLQQSGYYVTFDNTWRTVDSWSTVGNKAGGASILAISSNHTGVSSGSSALTLHHIKYDGSPSTRYGISDRFGLDIRNNSGDLQIKGWDGGTGLSTQGYVTFIYSESRQHIDN